MTRLVPYVTLVQADAAQELDQLIRARWDLVPAEVQRDIENMCIPNGWTVEMLVAGFILRDGLKAQADHTHERTT